MLTQKRHIAEGLVQVLAAIARHPSGFLAGEQGRAVLKFHGEHEPELVLPVDGNDAEEVLHRRAHIIAWRAIGQAKKRGPGTHLFTLEVKKGVNFPLGGASFSVQVPAPA